LRSTTILDQLNPEQRQAAEAVEGPVLIFAGAGSGKTRTLTHRIAHMIHRCGIPPERILAVTFTNKAANELKERLHRLIGEEAVRIWAGTFHWFCVRLLRADGEAIGVPRDFSIYDESDQVMVVKHALSALNISTDDFKPPAVLNEISNAKNRLLSVSEYRPERNNPLQSTTRKVYRVYQDELRRNGALDFDDLLMLAVQVLDDFPKIRRKYQERFQYLVVDEYQDINYAQFRLLELLAGEQRNICVVGDDDQSIYGWRGADVGLILAFTQHFPQARTFCLERNYRSTQRILDAANAIIAANETRAPKKLWTQNPVGEDLTLYAAVTEEEEAEWVAETISRLVAIGEAKYGDFGVLYRTNAMSRVFEEALMNLAIPYEIVGGLRFFERAEIKDLIAYLHVLQNPRDSIGLRRIINKPTRGIGDQTLSLLDLRAHQLEASLWEGLVSLLDGGELPPRTLQALRDFHDLVESLREAVRSQGLPQLVRTLLARSGYLERLKASANAEDARRAENVEEFVSVAARYTRKNPEAGLPEFLEYLALSSDIDQAENLGEVVSLLTLHSAKGLEFPCVFIVGLEEDILPHYRSVAETGELSEERRLLYVGMTRAQRRLWLSYAQRRMQFGEAQQNRPSRFLADLPKAGLRRVGGAVRVSGSLREGAAPDVPPELAMTGKPLDLTRVLSRSRKTAGKAPEPAEEDGAPRQFSPGDRVRSPKYGEGLVVSVAGEDEKQVVTVAFPKAGLHKFNAERARLDKIG
jgi:DNA helicase-2/ATP-dependent DNA helicase PcrA